MTTHQWSGRTVLVTGVSGFIGSHFAEGLLARGARVIGTYRSDPRGVLRQLPAADRLRRIWLDLSDEYALERIVAGTPGGVDAVVHCAALTGSLTYRRDHPATILDANTRTVSTVLNCARRHDIADVVLLSSGEVYLGATDHPTREEDGFQAGLPWAPDGYYLSKNYAEMLAETYVHEFGMRIFCPRLTSTYGPRDNFGPDTDRVVPRMFARGVSGRAGQIWGDGRQTRTYLHVTDLVDATLQMVEKNKHRTVNMGTPEAVTPVRLAQLIFAALGVPERITFDRTRRDARTHRSFDLARMDELIDFRPRGLADGLAQTAGWYRRHHLTTGERPQRVEPGPRQKAR